MGYATVNGQKPVPTPTVKFNGTPGQSKNVPLTESMIANEGAKNTGAGGEHIKEPKQIGSASEKPEFVGKQNQLTEEREKKLASSMYPSSVGLRKYRTTTD